MPQKKTSKSIDPLNNRLFLSTNNKLAKFFHEDQRYT